MLVTSTAIDIDNDGVRDGFLHCGYAAIAVCYNKHVLCRQGKAERLVKGLRTRVV